MPPPLVLWALSVEPPKSATPQMAIRQASRALQHGARKRRESPSGKDPTVELRYIDLLHLILRWKALCLNAVISGKSIPQNLAPVT